MMCGIAGLLTLAPQSADRLLAQTRSMAAALRARGPDDFGQWCDVGAGISLAHRRLAVIDLSPAGHQPMVSESGRWVLIYNGEVYNHLELREQLVGNSWRGHSDTETMLAGFDQWGVRATIERSVGMFAIAVWDREKRTLTLIRDRFGEKPIYYGLQGDTFLFGSELKALRSHPEWCGRIDRRALSLYMRHSAVGGEFCIYEGIRKLRPGSFIEIRLDAIIHRTLPEPKFYWRLDDAVAEGRKHLWRGDETAAIDELERVLGRAVQAQMASDVPLGAFLSGGVDSSTIVALMQAKSQRPIKTFTIGFTEAAYNEAEHAKAVATHLGTDHTELYVTPREAMAVIPRMGHIYDEPFADSSQIPTFLVAELARQHVTVSLSGDAGDELFGGYNRYVQGASSWRRLARFPRPIRSGAAWAVMRIPPGTWTRLLSPVESLLPSALHGPLVGDKLHKAMRAVRAGSSSELYQQLVSTWDPAAVVLGGEEPESAYAHAWPGFANLEEQMMAWDAVGYLPDDILVKVDRAAMAVSLETRVPLLDHRVAQFAWCLPLNLKIRGSVGKWALRQLLYRYVPRALIERPKMGFAVPIDSWLRGPLRDWAEDLLDEGRLRREGYLDPAPVRTKWREHVSGHGNWHHHLWTVLAFESWLECANQ